MSDNHIDGPMHLHEGHQQNSHEGEQAEDLTLRERPLDLAAVRENLPRILTSRICCTANFPARLQNGMKPLTAAIFLS